MPVHIGSRSLVEEGCEIIGQAWIGHGCHLAAGSRIVRSVIFEHTRVCGGEFSEQIGCGCYCVTKVGIAVEKDRRAAWHWSDARARTVKRAV